LRQRKCNRSASLPLCSTQQNHCAQAVPGIDSAFTCIAGPELWPTEPSVNYLSGVILPLVKTPQVLCAQPGSCQPYTVLRRSIISTFAHEPHFLRPIEPSFHTWHRRNPGRRLKWIYTTNPLTRKPTVGSMTRPKLFVGNTKSNPKNTSFCFGKVETQFYRSDWGTSDFRINRSPSCGSPYYQS
jgi:hypothetical protein